MLGTVHFFFPLLFDYKTALLRNGSSLKPFQLFFYKYQTQKSDLYGIVWVMNHCVSFVIVTIGFLDIFSDQWIHTSLRIPLALWISLWWFIRALTQFYLGRRRGDWGVFIFFSSLSILHVMVAL